VSEALEHRETARLRDLLAELEAERATLEAELAAFHAEYMRHVGTVMARVHELEARILAIVAERSGAAGDARAAAAAREQARKTTAEVRAIPAPARPLPTADLKRLFREAAKRMHPDLASDERARRHAEAFMKRLNQAYRGGDAAAIQDLVLQWDASPYALAPVEAGAAPAAREVSALRAAVERAQRRLDELRASELAEMLERAMATAASGGDFLAEMRADAETALAQRQARLAELTATRTVPRGEEGRPPHGPAARPE
jgi:hypothetical protein